jgi:hypothetical protein
MPAQLRVILTEEQDRTLRELREATKVPQRVKDRAQMLQLNTQGRSGGENIQHQYQNFKLHKRGLKPLSFHIPLISYEVWVCLKFRSD